MLQHNFCQCHTYNFNDGISVTRLGDLLHFGSLFKVCGKNYFAHILGYFCNVSKYFIFLVKSFWGNIFIDIWRPLTGHTGWNQHGTFYLC